MNESFEWSLPFLVTLEPYSILLLTTASRTPRDIKHLPYKPSTRRSMLLAESVRMPSTSGRMAYNRLNRLVRFARLQKRTEYEPS